MLDDEILKLVLNKLGNRYEFIKFLGQGSFSKVYLLLDKIFKRQIALKIMDFEYILKTLEKGGIKNIKEEFRKLKKRFEREAELYKREIYHPNIAKIYAVDFIHVKSQNMDVPYILMQFVEGITLAEFLDNCSQIELKNAISISINILDALNTIHHKGIVHRDIKPANIMIDKESGKAILIDFGIAKDILAGTKLTVTGEVIGSPLYMAPEQFEGLSTVGPKADIYSFGVVFFQMLSGEVPFKGGTRLEILSQHLNVPVPDIRKIKPDLPVEVANLISLAMTKKAEQRLGEIGYYKSVLENLKDGLCGNKTEVIKQPTEESKKNKIKILAYSTAVILIFIILFSYYFHKKNIGKNSTFLNNNVSAPVEDFGEEYKIFKKDPYTTSIYIKSTRYRFTKEQMDKVKGIRFDLEKNEFNIEGKGDDIYTDNIFSFSSLNLLFFTKDSIDNKIFEGRTVSQFDKKTLQAISKHLVHSNFDDYDLAKNWEDNERRIIVSKHLLERLGYKSEAPLKIRYLTDRIFRGRIYPFKIPVIILAVVDQLPFGNFIISEEFHYNINQHTFNPSDMIERFYVFIPSKKEKELNVFIRSRFNLWQSIIKIMEDNPNNRILYEITFKNFAFYKTKEFNRLRNESSKFYIIKQFENSGFECTIDYYDWKSISGNIKQEYPEFLTLHLKERYVDHLDELSMFLSEFVGGIKMDETILNSFMNFHKKVK